MILGSMWDKVRFLHSICPAQRQDNAWTSEAGNADERDSLGPNQSVPTDGHQAGWSLNRALMCCLSAVATWEGVSRVANVWKIWPKAHVSSISADGMMRPVMSYVNRLNVAFQDLGEVHSQRHEGIHTCWGKVLWLRWHGRWSWWLKANAEKIEQWPCVRLHTKHFGQVAQRQKPRNGFTQWTTWMMKLMKLTMWWWKKSHDGWRAWILQAMAETWGWGRTSHSGLWRTAGGGLFKNPLTLSLCFSAYSEARGRTRGIKSKSRGFWPAEGSSGKTFEEGLQLASLEANADSRWQTVSHSFIALQGVRAEGTLEMGMPQEVQHFLPMLRPMRMWMWRFEGPEWEAALRRSSTGSSGHHEAGAALLERTSSWTTRTANLGFHLPDSHHLSIWEIQKVISNMLMKNSFLWRNLTRLGISGTILKRCPIPGYFNLLSQPPTSRVLERVSSRTEGCWSWNNFECRGRLPRNNWHWSKQVSDWTTSR